jgi:hypothetical protein
MEWLFFYVKNQNKGGERMTLTPKQEKFCQGIVSGLSGKDAYMTAYNCKSDRAAMVESTKLLARDDVTERLKELRKPIETLCQSKAISEREKIKGILWERLQKAIDRDDDQTIVKYTDQINRMNAEYININRNIDDNAQKFDDLDVDTLKSILKPSQGD